LENIDDIATLGMESHTLNFPVVGIGASAGGLETFIELLNFLPADTGMAFILIQHLDPNHPSLLTEILSRVTKIPVIEVVDSTQIKPNEIYVMPAKKELLVKEGVLLVQARKDAYGSPTTIDSFFKSLALEMKNRAIGIILSGTGSDGAQGITEIKGEGGITIAQSVNSAKFSEMPQSAIATECVDFILSPEAIARELVRISKHPYVRESPVLKLESPPTSENEAPADITSILKAVQRVTGTDFSGYKRNTITRRISRRMLLCKKENLSEYRELLKGDSAEVQSLYQDLLIRVTSFFRDHEAFEALRNHAFPEIIKGRDPDSTIRVWVPGCSTGEEVYSLAMCLVDFLDQQKARFPVQFFGTDINELSVEKARRGSYLESSIHSVTPEYLKRFFTRADNGFQINKNIRDICVFARQNVVTDPPFSSLDLVSCRNLLIYLEPPLQKRVMSLFHYSLKSTGFLMLGNAESAGAFADLFSPTGKADKLYAKKAGLQHPRFDFVRGQSGKILPAGKPVFEIDTAPGNDDRPELDKEFDKAVAASRTVGVTINEHFEVIRVRGQTGLFLEPPAGVFTNDILKMAKPGVRGELAKALHRAHRDNVHIIKSNLRLKQKGSITEAELEVIPFVLASSKTRHFAVIFREMATHKTTPKQRQQTDDARTSDLEKELAETQEYLQSLVDKERSTSSDLRAVNEEILSSNEEIQSSNEELETAKEELQSTNEELATVNDELNHRNQSLSELNSDLNNLLGTVHVPVIMLSRDLIIRRYSALAETIMHLAPSDVGRNIRDFKPKLNVPDLIEIVTHVIESVSEYSQEIQDEEGRWFSLRVRPYQSLDKKIDGAVIALIDIGTLKNMRDYAEAIVRTIRESLLVLDPQLRIKSANAHYYRSFSTSPEQTEKKLIFEVNNGEWNIPEFRKLLEEILTKNTQFQDFEMVHRSIRKGNRSLLVNATALRDGSKEGDFILLAVEDVTERNKALATLRETADALETANLELEQFAFVASHDLQEPLRMVSSFMQLLSKKYLGKLDPDADEFINLAVDGAKRMQQLVHDLLHFSQCGKGELNYDRVDSARVLDDTIHRLQTLINETQVKVTFDFLPTLQMDEILLGQIFENLISNAIKFRGGKAPSVHISAIQRANAWEFSVADNGIGIESTYRDRIFLIFQRLHTKEKYAGTGIGLAMCKKIVERYGGRIWMDSSLGHGSTFFFTLPSILQLSSPTVGQLAKI
jgi:two-component system CheB/CheR fusion protein